MVSHKNVSKSLFSVPVPWILWLWSRTREQKYGDVSLVPRIMNTSALLCVSETITWTYASQPAGNENPCGNGQFWWFLITTCCRQTGNPSKVEQSSLQQTCWGKGMNGFLSTRHWCSWPKCWFYLQFQSELWFSIGKQMHLSFLSLFFFEVVCIWQCKGCQHGQLLRMLMCVLTTLLPGNSKVLFS